MANLILMLTVDTFGIPLCAKTFTPTDDETRGPVPSKAMRDCLDFSRANPILPFACEAWEDGKFIGVRDMKAGVLLDEQTEKDLDVELAEAHKSSLELMGVKVPDVRDVGDSLVKAGLADPKVRATKTIREVCKAAGLVVPEEILNRIGDKLLGDRS